MTNEEHRQLADILNTVKGKVALSNYDCDLMNELYPEGKWHKILGPEKVIHSTKGIRQECLWVNYEIPCPDKAVVTPLELSLV